MDKLKLLKKKLQQAKEKKSSKIDYSMALNYALLKVSHDLISRRYKINYIASIGYNKGFVGIGLNEILFFCYGKLKLHNVTIIDEPELPIKQPLLEKALYSLESFLWFRVNSFSNNYLLFDEIPESKWSIIEHDFLSNYQFNDPNLNVAKHLVKVKQDDLIPTLKKISLDSNNNYTQENLLNLLLYRIDEYLDIASKT